MPQNNRNNKELEGGDTPELNINAKAKESTF